MTERRGVLDGTAGLPELEPYVAFFGHAAPIDTRHSQAVVDGVIEVVAVEQPVVRSRIHVAYAQSAREGRPNAQKRRLLNHALVLAKRQRRIVELRPPAGSGLESEFRIESSSEVWPRVLGPRELSDVPLSEMLQILELLRRADSRLAGRQLTMTALTILGLRKMPRELPPNVKLALQIAEMPDGEQQAAVVWPPSGSRPASDIQKGAGSARDRQPDSGGADPGAPNPPQAPDSAAALDRTSAAERLADVLLASDRYRHESESSGRAHVSGDLVRDVVALLVSAGGRRDAEAIWQATKVPLGRQRMTVAALRRVLNRDGYPVLEVDGADLRLDTRLMIEQFELD